MEPLAQLFGALFSGHSAASNSGDARGMDSIPGSGRSPWEGNSNPLQYSCWKNSMDRGAWQATVHGVTKSWPWQHSHVLILSFKILVAFHCESWALTYIYFSLYMMYHTFFSTKDGITIDALIFLLLHRVDRKVPRMEIMHLWWGRIIETPENS